jgi:hypothetical protein
LGNDAATEKDFVVSIIEPPGPYSSAEKDGKFGFEGNVPP